MPFGCTKSSGTFAYESLRLTFSVTRRLFYSKRKMLKNVWMFFLKCAFSAISRSSSYVRCLGILLKRKDNIDALAHECGQTFYIYYSVERFESSHFETNRYDPILDSSRTYDIFIIRYRVFTIDMTFDMFYVRFHLVLDSFSLKISLITSVH